jgi:hypothetical protein
MLGPMSNERMVRERETVQMYDQRLDGGDVNLKAWAWKRKARSDSGSSSFPQTHCGVDIEVLFERLRNTEARLFKAQSDLIQEREEQRLAKARTRIEFENDLISEKALRRQQKIAFEQEIRTWKSETVCLRSALAAYKNNLLM